MAISNVDLWNEVRNFSPSFASHTSEATSDLFTAKGFEQLSSDGSAILNEFMGLSIRVFLQKITVASVKDLLDDQDFGEDYSSNMGGIAQRIAISSAKPISSVPIIEGGTSDPFVQHLAKTEERMFDQNFDYASLITVPDKALIKNMFLSEDGLSNYVAGIMIALSNGYKLQKYLNKLEALNAGIHSEAFPLKDTQKYEADDLTDAASIIAFIELVRNIVDAMVFNPASGAFNALGFESTQDKDRLRILVRPQLMNKIATISRLNSPENMNLPIKMVQIPDFGGLIPYITGGDVFAKGTIRTDSSANPTSATYKTATTNAVDVTIPGQAVIKNAVDIYDDLGTHVAFAFTITAEGSSTSYYIPDDLVSKEDPNEDVMAIIADKGYLFTTTQNPYEVEPIRNPRPYSYTNYWAKSEHNSIKVDHLYNLVTISKSSS